MEIDLGRYPDFNTDCSLFYDENDLVFEEGSFIEFIDRNLDRGDAGAADIIVRYMSGEVIISNDEKESYLYDWETALWRKSKTVEISNRFADIIYSIITFYEGILNNAMDGADPDLLKILNEKLKELGRVKKRHHYNRRRPSPAYNKASARFGNAHLIEGLNSTHPHLLPIQQGLIVDLRTGLTRPRQKEDMFTRECSVRMEPLSSSNRESIEKYFHNLFGEHDGLIEYMQTFLGYCLTGETGDKGFYYFLGSDLGGKEDLLGLMKRVLGDFCVEHAGTIITTTKDGYSRSAVPFRIKIDAARLVILSNFVKDAKLCVNVIKNTVPGGRESITNYRTNNLDARTITRCGKFVANTIQPLDCNVHNFTVEDMIRPIPFTSCIEGLGDERLHDGLINSFFTFIVEGAIKYYGKSANNRNIPVPECMLQLKRANPLVKTVKGQ